MKVRILDSMMYASKPLLAGEVADLPEDFASEQITKGRAVEAPEPEAPAPAPPKPEAKPEAPEPEAKPEARPHRRGSRQ